MVESYFIGLDSGNRQFVWRCRNSGFSFVPGLAFSNHVQFGQGCLSVNFEADDSEGKPLSPTKPAVHRDLTTGRRLIEFTADDGKRLRAEW